MSEESKLCPCRRCLIEQDRPRWHFIVCETCGNKRCPHATDHRHTCTDSNDSGQFGSVYGQVDEHFPEDLTDNSMLVFEAIFPEKEEKKS